MFVCVFAIVLQGFKALRSLLVQHPRSLSWRDSFDYKLECSKKKNDSNITKTILNVSRAVPQHLFSFFAGKQRRKLERVGK